MAKNPILLECLQSTYRSCIFEKIGVETAAFNEFLIQQSKIMMDYLWDEVNQCKHKVDIVIERHNLLNRHSSNNDFLNFIIASELCDFFASEIGSDRVALDRIQGDYVLTVSILPQYIGSAKNNENKAYLTQLYNLK